MRQRIPRFSEALRLLTVMCIMGAAPLFCSAAELLSIDVKDSYELFEPIVATITDEADVYFWDFQDSYNAIEIGDGRVVHVWAPAGRHRLKCLLLDIDWDKRTVNKRVVRAEFLVDNNGPGPDPNPDPDPDPQPVENLFGVVVYESSDKIQERDGKTVNFGLVIESKEVRELFGIGHWLPTDKDGEGLSAARQAYVDRAAKDNRQLPWLYLTDQKGHVLFDGALPTTEDKTAELYRKYKAKLNK